MKAGEFMQFFSKEPNLIFQQFSWVHFLMIGVLAAGVVAIILLAPTIRKSRSLRTWLPLIACVTAWIFEIVFYIWLYLNGLDYIKKMVPLELCSICMYLSPILLFTKKQSVFDILYFASFAVLMAILFPGFGGYGPDHFRFYHFFFTHMFNVLVCVYAICVLGFRLNLKSYLRFWAAALPYAFFTRWVDLHFQANYTFLRGPSPGGSPLNFLGDGSAYFIHLLLLAFFVFSILYVVGPKQKKCSNKKTIFKNCRKTI